MQEIWRWGNLGLAFVMELAALGIFAWWGWRAGSGTPVKLLLAIALPVLAAVAWGLFAAPTASYGSPVVTTVVKLLVFGLAALALWNHNHWPLAAAFVLIVATNLSIIRLAHLTP